MFGRRFVCFIFIAYLGRARTREQPSHSYLTTVSCPCWVRGGNRTQSHLLQEVPWLWPSLTYYCGQTSLGLVCGHFYRIFSMVMIELASWRAQAGNEDPLPGRYKGMAETGH